MTETYCEWAEELPANCPPPEAYIPANEEFYRIVNNYPVKDLDFFSYYALHGFKPKLVSLCQAKSVSVSKSLESCVEKLPLFKNGKIVRIVLTSKSGFIRKTGPNYHHFSWWRCKDFKLKTNTELVK